MSIIGDQTKNTQQGYMEKKEIEKDWMRDRVDLDIRSIHRIETKAEKIRGEG